MLLNDWLSSLCTPLLRKQGKRSRLSQFLVPRARSTRRRRQLSEQPFCAAQSEPLETRLLLAATNPVDLGTLDGTNGFRLDGIDDFDFSGGSVSNAGDVNGDGFDDLIIGATGADPGGDSFAGESYVVVRQVSIFG